MAKQKGPKLPPSDFTELHRAESYQQASMIAVHKFKAYMKSRCYGKQETLDAWHHWYAGYLTAAATVTAYCRVMT